MLSREALEREFDEIRGQIDRLETQLEHRPDYGMGKGDPLITRWELNRALLESLRERADSVQAALAKLDQGTYGVCERCGKVIHPDRMAVLPEARLCIECARDNTPETDSTFSAREPRAPQKTT